MEEIKSQVFTIDDLLLGKPREVRIYAGEFVLAPHYGGGTRGFLDDVAYLGVAERFGEIQGKSFMKLEPFYEIRIANGKLREARVNKWEHRNSLYPHFFKAIFTGPAEAIVQALREAPFSKDKMGQLADAVEGLLEPYNESLRELLENRNGAFVESA